MTIELEKVVYTASVAATGGRAGHATSSDGIIDLDLRPPVEMGGPGGATNPEQLFATGYAACFQGALGVAARRAKVDVAGSLVTANVSIGPVGAAYGLAVELDVLIPGIEEELCRRLVEEAHWICRYSNATRGNIRVTLTARVSE